MITRATYWDHPGVSQSMLKELDRSPWHYHERYVARTVPEVDKVSLRRGRAIHALVFEPEDFDRRFPTFYGEKRSAEDKARFAAMDEAAAALDGCALREGDAADVRGMAAALRADRYVASLLERVMAAELPIEWECQTTGTHCKARLDALAFGGDAVIDLKSTANGSREAFAKSIHNFGYALQAAHYLAGIEARTGKRPSHYLLVVVESEPPHAVAHYRLGARSIEAGERERIRLLDLLAECRDRDHWPAYTQGFEDLEMPDWAL